MTAAVIAPIIHRTTTTAQDGPVLRTTRALRDGRPVLLTGAAPDDYLVLAAQEADQRRTAWLIRHSSGFLFAPLPARLADHLDLPPMTRRPDAPGTAALQAVGVDAAAGVSTGISAGDRARTARVLADEASTPADLSRPGHLVPLRARDDGLAIAPGPAEAAVELCRLAGLRPVALVATPVGAPPDGGPDGAGLPTVSLHELLRFRSFHGDAGSGRVRRGPADRTRSHRGVLTTVALDDQVTGAEHRVVRGPVTAIRPTVRVHRRCSADHDIDGWGCPCRARLDRDLVETAASGGVLVLLGRDPRPEPGPDRCDAGALAAVLAEFALTEITLAPGPVQPADLSHGGVTSVPALRAPQES